MHRMMRFARISFIGFAWLFAACIATQTLLAGAAVFTDASHWQYHTAFVHTFEFVPLLMALLAWIGQYPIALRWQSMSLFVLIIAQYATAHIPAAGALHPVIALGLFALAIRTARSATHERGAQRGGGEA